jgi:hypothetical protein
MRTARLVRTSGLLLVIGLAGSGGGCGVGSQPTVDQEKQVQIRESKKAAHQRIKEDARKGQQGAMPQGARRGAGG